MDVLKKTQPFNFRILINKCSIRSHERILQPRILQDANLLKIKQCMRRKFEVWGNLRGVFFFLAFRIDNLTNSGPKFKNFGGTLWNF
jgi:hypothetical protein